MGDEKGEVPTATDRGQSKTAEITFHLLLYLCVQGAGGRGLHNNRVGDEKGEELAKVRDLLLARSSMPSACGFM